MSPLGGPVGTPLNGLACALTGQPGVPLIAAAGNYRSLVGEQLDSPGWIVIPKQAPDQPHDDELIG